MSQLKQPKRGIRYYVKKEYSAFVGDSILMQGYRICKYCSYVGAVGTSLWLHAPAPVRMMVRSMEDRTTIYAKVIKDDFQVPENFPWVPVNSRFSVDAVAVSGPSHNPQPHYFGT